MNNKSINEAFERTRAAVKEAKARGEKSLLFLPLYCGWSDIRLSFDEKEELKKRFAAQGWKLQNEYLEGDPDWTLERKVILSF
jgi:hypothetical protein